MVQSPDVLCGVLSTGTSETLKASPRYSLAAALSSLPVSRSGNNPARGHLATIERSPALRCCPQIQSSAQPALNERSPALELRGTIPAMILCEKCSTEFKTVQGLRGHEQMGCPEDSTREEDNALHDELLATIANLETHLRYFQSKCSGHEQEIRNLQAQLQEGFPTCPTCGLPRSRHFGMVNDLPWKYACPSSPHPATTRQPTTPFISPVTGKPNNEITAEIARLAATHQAVTIGPGRDNDHRNMG